MYLIVAWKGDWVRVVDLQTTCQAADDAIEYLKARHPDYAFRYDYRMGDTHTGYIYSIPDEPPAADSP